MPPTTTFECGDVLLVWYVHTDGAKTEKRPAVVVSTTNHNRSSLDAVLMALTSQKWHAGDHGAVQITDWKEAGLLLPSVAKPVFFTYDQKQVLKKLGRVGNNTITKLKKAIASVFGFNLRSSAT